MVAVGSGDATVEGRELPPGEVAGDLEVVEGVVVVHVADQVDEIEAGEHVPGEPGPVGQDAPEEQDEQRVAQPGGQSYPRRIQAAGGQDAPATHRRGDVRRGHLVHVPLPHNASLRESAEANLGGAPAASARTASKAPRRG